MAIDHDPMCVGRAGVVDRDEDRTTRVHRGAQVGEGEVVAFTDAQAALAQCADEPVGGGAVLRVRAHPRVKGSEAGAGLEMLQRH